MLNDRSCLFAYHEVVTGDSKYLYRVSTAAFSEQLSQIAMLLAPEPKRCIVSFDDGHRSQYDHALEVLNRNCVMATFFVLPGLIGTEPRYLSWQQIREIAAAGHSIQSHGWSHRVLTHCSELELRRELRDSKKEIEQRLGVEVHSISVPGGRWNRRVAEASAEAGYRCLYHSNAYAKPRPTALSLHGRVMVTGQMKKDAFLRALQPNRAQRWLGQTKNSLKEVLRLTVGDRRYHHLWCWLANWKSDDGMEISFDRASEL